MTRLRPLPTLLALTFAAAFGGFAATAIDHVLDNRAEAATPTAIPALAALPPVVDGTPVPSLAPMLQKTMPAVVSINTKQVVRVRNPFFSDPFFRRLFPDIPQERINESLGSGVIIDAAKGYVLTNHHVIDGAESVKVKLSDRREFTAKVVGSDAQYDVALLKIDGKNLPTVRVGDSNTLKPGQWVVAIGSPFGLDHSVTAGIVSATGRSNPYADQRYVPFIQTDVAINQGNSGGPLLNTRGEVVGINSQIFSASGGYMGISFAIPIDLAMGAVEQIKKNGKVSRGQLGVMVGAVTADAAEGLKLPDSRGALVNQMVADSSAAKAGIEVGDVIRSVNGTAINDASELPPMIGAMPPGSRVRMGILRDGKPRDITVTLTELAEDAARQGASAAGADTGKPQVGANALLGLDVADLTAAERSQLGLEAGEGVRITGVKSQAAREARLSPGMVVLQVGRTPVGSVAALNRELAAYKKGDVVMLLVRAGGNSAFVAVRAGE